MISTSKQTLLREMVLLMVYEEGRSCFVVEMVVALA
jgi:hypothetical protein